MSRKKKYKNTQEYFWGELYAEEYIKKNTEFDYKLGAKAWKSMLKKSSNIQSLLECGPNIGRNLIILNELFPESTKSIIEISEHAFKFICKRQNIKDSFNGSIVDSEFLAGSYDLVFTIGVLIHIDPNSLLANMEKMFQYSNKYILIGEYFNRTPVAIEYQGHKDKLFKQDFGKLFINNFNVKLLDYGFLWGHLYDAAGSDDITWWLFEKK